MVTDVRTVVLCGLTCGVWVLRRSMKQPSGATEKVYILMWLVATYVKVP